MFLFLFLLRLRSCIQIKLLKGNGVWEISEWIASQFSFFSWFMKSTPSASSAKRRFIDAFQWNAFNLFPNRFCLFLDVAVFSPHFASTGRRSAVSLVITFLLLFLVCVWCTSTCSQASKTTRSIFFGSQIKGNFSMLFCHCESYE